jgi:general L-amino acid transport system permease protein
MGAPTETRENHPQPEEPLVPDEDQPVTTEPLGQRLKEGLFGDLKNTVLTLVFGTVLLYVAYRSYLFLFANLKPTPDGDLVNSWNVVRDNLELFVVGNQFGRTGISYSMLWAAAYLAVFAIGFAVGPVNPAKVPPMTWRTRISIMGPALGAGVVFANFTETLTPIVLMLLLPVALAIGFYLPRVLPEVVVNRRGIIAVVLAALVFALETGFDPSNVDDFGGLLLTLNVAFISIAASFPLGVILALARRSSFPLIRPIAVAYIELIRGVPLITLLFMGAFALAFFLPPGSDAPPGTIRSIIMFTLFSAAYVAEIVRGGLQSVHKGQTEAGQAIGLSPATVTARIVLPQALRNSIPPLVGQFIALLKDTSLLIIIGQFDILGVTKPMLSSLAYANQGYFPETYAFVAFLFWIICFSMSRASQRLETKLGVGTR